MSMVDYVIQEKNRLGLDGNTYKCFAEKVINYANFLKQPLSIEMFVPCKLVDGFWVVLEEPIDNTCENCNHKQDFDICCRFEEYQEAKERCLFEGFTFEHTSVVKYENYVFSIKDKTIENLIRIYCYPKLTDSAQKQIEL